MDDFFSYSDPGGLTDFGGYGDMSPAESGIGAFNNLNPGAGLDFGGGGGLMGMLGGMGGMFKPGAGGGIPGLAAGLPLLGLLAGLGGAAFGGNPSSRTTPQLSPQANQFLGQAGGAYGQGLGVANQMLPSQMGLYNQGAGLMAGMAGGQIPPWMTALIQQAYQPYIQDITGQSINAARSRGFASSGPQDFATGGPASQIGGLALSRLPGQMAQQTLNFAPQFAQQLMGQGQQGLQNMQGLAGGFSGLGLGLPAGQTQQQNQTFMQKLQGAGPLMQGMGQMGAAFAPQQANPFAMYGY